MEYKSTSLMAEEWGLSRRRVTKYCQEGRIEGAVLVGNTWVVPADAEKPEDKRKTREKTSEHEAS